MKQEESIQTTDKESVSTEKKIQSNKTINALLIGLLIGVAVWSAVNNGLSFWTIFPLIIAYIAFRSRK